MRQSHMLHLQIAGFESDPIARNWSGCDDALRPAVLSFDRISMQQSEPSRQIGWGRLIRLSLSVAVVGVIFLYVLPRIVDYGDVIAVMGAMTWFEAATLVVLAVWNQVTYGLMEMSARPGLNPWQAMKITLVSTAVSNSLPAGAALGVGLQTAMYSSFRFAKPDIAISLMTTGVWNTFVKLAMPIVALVLVAIAGEPSGGMLVASAVGLVVVLAAIGLFAGALRSEQVALRVGRVMARIASPVAHLLRRPSVEDLGPAIVDFRRRTIHLLKGRWGWITSAAVVSHVTLYLLLLLTLRHVGVSNEEVSWQAALAAFTFVRLITVIPITPGGLGVVELGLTAALVAAGGPEAQVVAGVLIFRVLSFVLPIPLGAIAYVFWRKGATARAQDLSLPVSVG